MKKRLIALTMACSVLLAMTGCGAGGKEESAASATTSAAAEAEQIDWENDTFDGGDHLNLFGARKMTKYLGDYLASECDLTDHRGDPAYRSWQELWTSYEQEVERMKGTSYPLMEAE